MFSNENSSSTGQRNLYDFFPLFFFITALSLVKRNLLHSDNYPLNRKASHRYPYGIIEPINIHMLSQTFILVNHARFRLKTKVFIGD